MPEDRFTPWPWPVHLPPVQGVNEALPRSLAQICKDLNVKIYLFARRAVSGASGSALFPRSIAGWFTRRFSSCGSVHAAALGPSGYGPSNPEDLKAPASLLRLGRGIC